MFSKKKRVFLVRYRVSLRTTNRLTIRRPNHRTIAETLLIRLAVASPTRHRAGEFCLASAGGELMRRESLFCLLVSAILAGSNLQAQVAASEQVQVAPPVVGRAEPPPANATAEDLEERGDQLRAE